MEISVIKAVLRSSYSFRIEGFYNGTWLITVVAFQLFNKGSPNFLALIENVQKVEQKCKLMTQNNNNFAMVLFLKELVLH